MYPGTNLRVSCLARLFSKHNQTPRPTISHKSLALKRTSASKLIFGAALAVVAVAFAAHASPQQPDSGTTYGPIAKPSPNHYPPPDVQAPPQNSYAPPQTEPVQQPQYQPQYAQPQAPPQNEPEPQSQAQPQSQVVQQPQYQPQYAEPQPQPQAQQDQQPYPPQYSAPQQPYAQQPQYAPQPYPDQQPGSAQAQPYAEPDQNQQAAPAQSLSAEDLEQLLAPIALYPDSLLAQVLAASTYPAQVAVADQWLQQMRAAGYSSPEQIAAGANAQTSWDPSIKALTAFPDVLDLMNHDLQWTSNLGNAYYNQPQDVMQTVQVLRDRAEQAGNLQSTPQEEVQNDQGYVELAPTDPQVVYVPTYNPWDVYGAPIAPYPGFSFCGALGNFFGGLPIQYGLSFALGAFDHMPFGWLAWGFDWLGHVLLFDHAGYYTHSRQVADWGLPRGGPRAYYGRDGNGGLRDGQYRQDGQYRSNGQYRSDGQYQSGQRPYDPRQSYNQGGNYQRGGFSNNRGPAQSPAQSYVRPAQGFPEPGRLNDPNRGPQQPGNSYTRLALPSQQSYDRSGQAYTHSMPQQNYGYRPQTYPNRAPTYANPSYSSRPQNDGIRTYGNPGANYGYTGRSNYGYNGPQNYAARPNSAYSNSYRAPQPDYSREFSNRSFENYGNTMARNERSGGFRPFSGGQSKSYSSERAPSYSYKAPKNFGGGHQNFGGGHEKAPKMSHSSGGGGHRR
jgi:Protein of unknown function (DUF3300)